MAIWEDKIIGVNTYARSGKKLSAVRKIVMHYTANPGASAENHYKYFSNLKDRYASAHFFVDSKDALCIIPLNELAYHCNDVQKRVGGAPYRGVSELRPNGNQYSIGIEMCIEKDGSFHPETLKKSEDVAAELCRRYKLDPQEDIVRHYDVTAKNCPAPWVSDSSGFKKFKANVSAKLNGGKLPSQPAQDVAPTPTLLKKGSKGDSVGKLQENLNKLGFDCGKADGLFGANTLKAVKAFQTKFKLDVDGLVGSATLDTIKLALAELDKPKEEAKPEPVKEEKKAEVVKEAPKKVDVKINSLGDKYSFQVKAKKNLTVFDNADLTGKVKTLKKDNIFSVYGFDNDGKVFAVGGGNYVSQSDVEPIPLHIRTGGINPTMEKEFRAFLKENKIEAQLNIVTTGSPSSDLLVAGIELYRVKKWLDGKGWYYNVK
ncbi:peptidoglycan recognition protein family protein [Priestia megaterium]|uniref:peptidoglycan recognition protein family protein n=1 Tax=Priestia megaterium TaxID=1404 RepID=UPI002877F9E5|nr:N-acetylmuramoyl-L-alanine amidase [Priestia megaterium]